MRSFQQGETVEALLYVYDYNDTLIAQDGATITINSPDGTEVLIVTAMTETATGVYCYNYSLAVDALEGIWTVKIISTEGTNLTVENEMFKVKTAI